jgi:hypothetical protein
MLPLSFATRFGLHGHLQVFRIFYINLLEEFCFAAFFYLFSTWSHSACFHLCFSSVFLRSFCSFLACVFVCLGVSILVRPGDGFFIPSTQRHYRRLIYYYIILLHVSVIRPSSSRNILLARITQLTIIYCTFASCRTLLFHFHFSFPSFVRLIDVFLKHVILKFKV